MKGPDHFLVFHIPCKALTASDGLNCEISTLGKRDCCKSAFAVNTLAWNNKMELLVRKYQLTFSETFQFLVLILGKQFFDVSHLLLFLISFPNFLYPASITSPLTLATTGALGDQSGT